MKINYKILLDTIKSTTIYANTSNSICIIVPFEFAHPAYTNLLGNTFSIKVSLKINIPIINKNIAVLKLIFFIKSTPMLGKSLFFSDVFLLGVFLLGVFLLGVEEKLLLILGGGSNVSVSIIL
jgi:hypothetical protein